ncbi:MAG: hypothetical protein KDA92_03655 [Planctomycetales bacterium]|nr:hypothetical protein [Planctomycetales bacterium]
MKPFRRVALTLACLSIVTLCNRVVTAQEPGWASEIVAGGVTRQAIESTPMINRPYRPLHFYGNTVRRIHYRGTALPAPRDFRSGLQVATRRPYVPVASYVGRGR